MFISGFNQLSLGGIRQLPINSRILIKIFFVVMILLGPFVVGAFSSLWFWLIFIGSLAITIYAVLIKSERAKKITLVLVSVAFTITLSDLALRFLPVVPDDLIEEWPTMPLVNRYAANLNYEGNRFNDLSRMAGVKEWMEDKRVRIITDSAGFRNERTDQTRTLDVILLGDSVGGGAVSQDDTWTSILAREHNLSTYNLSVPATSPWQEYVNLWAEKDRLKTGKGTILLWQLFTGNDLDEYYGSMEVDQLPWRGPVGAWLNRINSLRAGSPLRYVLQSRNRSGYVVDRDFLNGRKLLFYQPYIEASSRSPEEIVKHPNYTGLRATIRAVKRLAESQELRLIIVLVPAKEEVYAWVWNGTPPWTTKAGPSGFATILKDICAEEHLLFLDLKPSLVSESRRIYEESGQLLYWYDDTHMNTAGYRFTISVIYNELAQRPRSSL